MELLNGSQLKPGNYYKVESQPIMIYVIDYKHHIRLYFNRYDNLSISTHRNMIFCNLDSYIIASEYSFKRVLSLINNIINKNLA